MPTERRLPIGFLSAHVTAATVHVLSRVSPITLALSLSLTFHHYLTLDLTSLTLALFLLMFLSRSVFFTLSLLLFLHSALFHHSMSFSIVFLPLSFSLVALSYVLLPSVFTSNLPPGPFPPLANIFSVSPDFELQAMLFVSFPIYHCPSRAIDSGVCLCRRLITDVDRRWLKQSLTSHLHPDVCTSLLMTQLFFFFSSEKTY